MQSCAARTEGPSPIAHKLLISCTGPIAGLRVTARWIDKPAALSRLFESFWMGGFEGADHVNGLGEPLNPNIRNGHAWRIKEDYEALAALGLRTVASP